jgi:hypothetical protein
MTEITKGVKLVNKDLTAYGGFQYTKGEWAKANGVSPQLCGDGMLHFYRDPLLAELLNPIHGAYTASARLFEVEVEGPVRTDRGLKYGAKRLRLVREIERKPPTTGQRVEFARMCADWAAEAARGSRMDGEEIRAKLLELAEKACA